MPKKPPYARIAITLPAPVLAAADRLAKRLDRSRSWVVAESIRSFVSDREHSAQSPGPASVREPFSAAYQAEQVADARVRLIQSDLAVSPGERLRRAEELIQLSRLIRPRARREQVIAFDSWEDFAQWKAAQRIRL
jgi:hypothetical protein